MKLTELLENQRLTVQLLWGEQKIEFFSEVIGKDDASVYVNPYLHNGSILELNVSQGAGVVCNLFTTDPSNKQRISWKGVELTTVVRKDKTVYRLKTNGYNNTAIHDDRRKHERLVIMVKAQVFDGQSSEGTDILVHDVSDNGFSFYAPKAYVPQSHLLTIAFSDSIDGKEFEVRAAGTIARTTTKAGNTLIGCKISGENKDYLIYCFMKRLWDKNKNKAQ